MNDMEIRKSYSIEQVENEQHLIINVHYMNQKVATTDAGSIDNIMEKVKLFSEEYETLQQENQLMFKIQDDYFKLQSNWNSLREWLEVNDRYSQGYFKQVLEYMNELEGKDKECF